MIAVPDLGIEVVPRRRTTRLSDAPLKRSTGPTIRTTFTPVSRSLPRSGADRAPIQSWREACPLHRELHDLVDPERYYVATDKMRLVGRMHGRGWYARTSDLFLMDRISLAEWQDGKR